MAAILDIGTELINSEFPCHPDASHQVSAQTDLVLGGDFPQHPNTYHQV